MHRACSSLARAVTITAAQPRALACAPLVARVGSHQSPQLDSVRHAAKGSMPFHVDTEVDESGKILVSGSWLATQEGLAKPAGVSTTERSVPDLALGRVLADNRRRIWTLEEGTAIPASLAVRRDPRPGEERRVLWAPAHTMPVEDYETALRSVGTDAWRCWDSLDDALQYLCVPASERERLMTQAHAFANSQRAIPTTPAQLTGKAAVALAMDEVESGTSSVFLDAMGSVGLELADGTLPLQAVQPVPPTTGCAAGATPPGSSGGKRSYHTAAGHYALIFMLPATPVEIARSATGAAFIRRALTAVYEQLKVDMHAEFDNEDKDDDNFRLCEHTWRLWKQAADTCGVPHS